MNVDVVEKPATQICSEQLSDEKLTTETSASVEVIASLFFYVEF